MGKKEQKISANVKVLGLVSFFNDMASEMIYPIIPVFITGVLGAPVAVVGLIEGIAESSSSILKVFSGWFSDKFKRRKIFVAGGYFLSSISKLLLGAASSWPVVLSARFTDRLGKGLRTSPRDALISESSDESNRGRAFGFHRALDTVGAVIGPLLAIIILKSGTEDLRNVFFIAFIPGILGVLLLIFFVREKKNKETDVFHFKVNWKDFKKPFKIFLLVSLVFAIGNSSDAFLILRAQDLGFTLTMTILAYVSYNFIYAAFSTHAGIISDRIGAKGVLLAGFFMFSAVYLLFALIDDPNYLWLLFPLYGLYMAFTDGVGKAYISGLVPSHLYGTAFGIYHTAVGLATFFASLIAGLLWDHASPHAPFFFGSAMAVFSAFIFLIYSDKKTRFSV